MTIFMVALVGMIVGIGVAMSKDVMELLDFAYDPNNPTKGPRRV